MRKLLALLLVALMLTPMCAMADGTIKIGIFEPVTGSYAGGGAMHIEGYELAKELFPTVLDMTVEFVVGDSKSDKVEASSAAASIVGSGAVAVLGSYASGLCLVGADVFADAGIPAITATGTNPMVTQGDWYARICFIDPFQGTMLAKYCVDQEYKKIAIIQEIESEYAVGLSTYFQQEIEKNEGFEITTVGNFVNTDQDFSTLLTDALSNSPDVLITPVGFAPSAALIVKQARELGFTGPILGGDTLDAPELFEIAGEYAAGVIFTTFYDSAQPATEKTSQFLDAYKAKYGKEPAGPNIMAFDAYLTLIDAIERAGSTDPAAIRDAIFETNGFVGAAGVITLNETHDAVRPVVFKEVGKDGTSSFLALVEP